MCSAQRRSVDGISAGGHRRGRSKSSSRASRVVQIAPVPTMNKGKVPERHLSPCAATASFFLYSQGSTILCLHHDTLAVQRRFQLHNTDILFIAVDNVSESGSGRLVVSYDVKSEAIVWDLYNGAEIARFTSFESLSVASWMRNGNIAFGMLTCNRRLHR